MGWWSHKIMGGDRPLDVLALFSAEIGARFDPHASGAWRCYVGWDGLGAAEVQRLAERLDGMQRDQSIAAQVLATALIRSGAPIDHALRDRLASLIAQDEWAAECEDRAEEIGRLVAALAAYDGSPAADVDDEGLAALMEQP
jgi:hypothetical protein